MNSFNCRGNVVSEPTVRFVGEDLAVTDITVAIQNREKRGGEWVDEPVFLDVTYWGKAAEYLGEEAEKGDKIFVTGKLVQENWVNKEGEKRSKIKVNADRAHFPALMKAKPRSEG